VTIVFQAKREEFVGYCQSACAIGLMIGPVMGSFIYGFVGYQFTFYIIAAILLACCILVFFVLPNELNTVDDAALEDEEQ